MRVLCAGTHIRLKVSILTGNDREIATPVTATLRRRRGPKVLAEEVLTRVLPRFAAYVASLDPRFVGWLQTRAVNKETTPPTAQVDLLRQPHWVRVRINLLKGVSHEN
jgi:hypothetical protein